MIALKDIIKKYGHQSLQSMVDQNPAMKVLRFPLMFRTEPKITLNPNDWGSGDWQVHWLNFDRQDIVAALGQ